jgi:hypothetical protein
VKQVSTTLDEYVYTPNDQVVEREIEAGRVYGESYSPLESLVCLELGLSTI